MTKTIGYKMTHDSGFAPNPFHGFLSLATCKPMIRRTRIKGDWVAGFASKRLVNDAKRQGRELQYMSLIFLMEVDQIVPIEEYFTDKNYSSKKPENESGPIRYQTCSSEADYISLVGDNIYQKDNCSLGFRQTPNIFHKDNPHTIKHDTKGKNVLIANNFFYFGGNGFIPNGGWGKLTTEPLPEARQFKCPVDFQSKLIEYFNAHEIHPGRHGWPTDWPPKCPPTT